MALDKLSLINRACAIIGADPIDALDEDTPGAQIVSLRYDSLLEFCIGLPVHGFTFATATRQLSRRDGVTILNGWRFCHALPPDRIGQPIKVSPTADWPRVHFTDYIIEGNDAYSDCDALYALIHTLPEPAAMSGTFRRAFETALAGEFAMGLASDKKLRDQLLNDAFGPPSMQGTGGMMGAAIQADRASTPSNGPTTASDPLTRAHAGGSGPYGRYTFP